MSSLLPPSSSPRRPLGDFPPPPPRRSLAAVVGEPPRSVVYQNVMGINVELSGQAGATERGNKGSAVGREVWEV